MELFELHNAILHNKIPKFLIFTGDEYAIKDIYIQKISGALKRSVTPTDNISTVLTGSRIISLVGKDSLYIDKYDKTIVANEKLWIDITQKLKNNYLILIFSDIDKRSRFYTTFKNNIVEFGTQTPKVLRTMLKAQIDMSDENLDDLATRNNNNYGKCLLEADKIRRFAKIKNIDNNIAYKQLLDCGAISGEYTDVIFTFVNSVMKRWKNCYKYYKVLKSCYESNIKILSLLYSSFKNQLIVETVKGASQENTGLNPYTIKTCLNRAGTYSIKELKFALNKLVEIEQGIKIGKIEEPIAIDYFLAMVL